MEATQTYENILYHIQAGVCTITLNRPQVFNALNAKLIEEIIAAIQQAGEDPLVRVVVITGAGDKAFCSGADLKEAVGLADKTPISDTLRKRYNPMILGIRQLPKPVICRLNGVAAGAGCSLALACDLVIASEQASLVEIFINIGLVMDAGSSYFLPRLVGSARAFELCTTGRPVKAQEAAEIGLISRVVPASQLDESVAQLSSYYAQAPTKAIGLIKKLLNKSYESTLEQMLELEAVHQDMASNTHDSKEGIQAFLEKRRPQFIGS
ncbi:MAG: enoyl-CoA hydratase-related protein [Bacteroidota bacterium]